MIFPMKNTPRALILAGGKGTRMGAALPKVLHPLQGRPMLHYVIEAVKKSGAQPIAVICGPHNIKAIRASHPPAAVDFIIQDVPLGTGHAVLSAAHWLKDYDGALLILVGDAPHITPEILKRLYQKQIQTDAVAVFLTVHWPGPPPPWGRVLRDANGRVTGIVEEKDATEQQKNIREVSSSHYCFNSILLMDALQHIGNDNAQKEYYLPDVIGILAGAGHRIETVRIDETLPVMGINTRQDLARSEQQMKRKEI